MKFYELLNVQLEDLHLLKHPFYKMWNEGTLDKDTLKFYAKEYYHHVAAFPRYISNIHTNCADIKARQVLLENLVDEEQGENNHPELWLRFAEGLGETRTKTKSPAELHTTKELVDGYFDLVKEDYATGLGALYAYERQTPEVAKSKIDGLKKHYAINDKKTLEFFTVHMQADEWHTQEIADLIEQLDDSSKERAAMGAKKGAELLWKFLDGIMEQTINRMPA